MRIILTAFTTYYFAYTIRIYKKAKLDDDVDQASYNGLQEFLYYLFLESRSR